MDICARQPHPGVQRSSWAACGPDCTYPTVAATSTPRPATIVLLADCPTINNGLLFCSMLPVLAPLPQMIIYPQSTVMATFCCDAEAKEDVKVTFRVIYSGVGVVDPPSPR